ncbi:hypothetical protein [Noviherbaspirillum sp. Root189]|uniref:hypothetical protein n=1 Tax=Noviherbaspirillum sp. Root189 TaxID=1736487 RepID=UPI00138F3412|nr:hypothetical protein [Noviherbaspirillum sp. Root189]
MRSTIFDKSENEKIAAAVMLMTPATVVASRMESSAESMVSLAEYATKLQIKAQTSFFGKWDRQDAAPAKQKSRQSAGFFAI